LTETEKTEMNANSLENPHSFNNTRLTALCLGLPGWAGLCQKTQNKKKNAKSITIHSSEQYTTLQLVTKMDGAKRQQ